jgi:hypothetical protein
MVLFGSRDPGDEPVLFHYTGAEKLALILTSQRLWLKSGTEVPPDLRRRLVNLAGMPVLADA